MAIWDDVLSGQDRDVYEFFSEHFRTTKELGKKPAVVVVDVNYAFVGFKPEPMLESIKTFHTSCGETGWAAIPYIQSLLGAARAVGIPIFYSTSIADTPLVEPSWASRARDRELMLASPEVIEKRKAGAAIVKEIEPQAQDILLHKRAASVFNGTPFISYLNDLDIDTLLVAGTTTSGCVRATVVDAANYNFYVGIVEECTFDRFLISHKVSLMDMDAKYGTVISLSDALSYLETGAEPTLPVGKATAV